MLIGAIAQGLPRRQPSRDMTQCGELYRYVATAAASPLASEVLGPILAANKPVLISDPYIYGQLVKHGKWPDEPLLHMVEEKQIGLIVLGASLEQIKHQGSDVWPDPVIDAMAANYRMVRSFNCRNASVVLEPALGR
jgi:hypothetical protein